MHKKHSVFSDLLKLNNISISDSNCINGDSVAPQHLCSVSPRVHRFAIGDNDEIPRHVAASSVCKDLDLAAQGLTCPAGPSLLPDAVNGYLQPRHTGVLAEGELTTDFILVLNNSKLDSVGPNVKHPYHLIHEHLHCEKVVLVDTARSVNKEVNVCLLDVYTA